jgi:hypothetical protein
MSLVISRVITSFLIRPPKFSLRNGRRDRPYDDALFVSLVSPGMGLKRLVMNAIPGLQYKGLFAHSDRQLTSKDKAEFFSWISGRLIS